MVNIVKALQDSDVLMKGVSKTLKNDAQKGGALPLIPMLLGTLGVSSLSGKGFFRVGEGLFRAEQGIKKKVLISPKPHPLTNFEIMYKMYKMYKMKMNQDLMVSILGITCQKQ